MLVLTTASAASTLADDEDMKSELALIAPSAASTLLEELERLTLDV
jgi:hypothetical protein